MKLSQINLDRLPPEVSTPNYDRSLLKPGIVHIGVGNFHRSHQAVYLNELFNQGADPAWAIRGAGVRAPDARMREMLAEQDWLYSVVEVDFDSLNASVIGSIVDFEFVEPAGNRPLIAAMAHPDTRIVSLTVTEGGYFRNEVTGVFDLSHEAVVSDIRNPNEPNTVFGAILAALKQRKADGTKPFTVMSCDNLPGNGDVARNAIASLAQATDPEFAKWIGDEVSFPNGMVDRITPATSDLQREMLIKKFGIQDNFPVFCEPFRQWVLEDSFVNGRPELESVGVTFTDNIHDFEKMKIRILNGGHAILAYVSSLLSIEFAHEAMDTPLVKDFLIKTLEQDVLPFVPGVAGYTPQEYLELICTRFANPGVADTIERLCHDGSNRQPKFIIPSVRDNLQAGREPSGLALACALWCRYCNGVTDAGKTIAPNDPEWTKLQIAARAAQNDPNAWLDQEQIYGSLGRNIEFRNVFAKALRSLKELGTETTIKNFLAGTSLH